MALPALDPFLSIPGWTVESLLLREKNVEVPEVIFCIERKEARYRCPCGREFTGCYDRTLQEVRDLSYGKWQRAWLWFHRARVDCPRCGVVTEELDWVAPWARITNRLADAVAIACKEVRSIAAVAESFGLYWHLVKEIDKAALKKRLDPPDFSKVERIAVDEIAIRKGQSYATIVIDFDRHKVLWVGEDRKQETMDAFYKLLGTEGCKRIKAVAMDMWKPFQASTREHCPHAEIVYDQFHLIQKFSKVIDEVRNAEKRRMPPKNVRSSRGRSISSSRTARTWSRRRRSGSKSSWRSTSRSRRSTSSRRI